jgi:hypothetical protein
MESRNNKLFKWYGTHKILSINLMKINILSKFLSLKQISEIYILLQQNDGNILLTTVNYSCSYEVLLHYRIFAEFSNSS